MFNSTGATPQAVYRAEEFIKAFPPGVAILCDDFIKWAIEMGFLPENYVDKSMTDPDYNEELEDVSELFHNALMEDLYAGFEVCHPRVGIYIDDYEIMFVLFGPSAKFRSEYRKERKAHEAHEAQPTCGNETNL